MPNHLRPPCGFKQKRSRFIKKLKSDNLLSLLSAFRVEFKSNKYMLLPQSISASRHPRCLDLVGSSIPRSPTLIGIRRASAQRRLHPVNALPTILADVDVVLSVTTAAEIGRALVAQASAVLPAPLQPLVTTLGNDFASLLDLKVTALGVARLGALYYLGFTRPAPLGNLLDFYVFGPLGSLTARRYTESDFTLRDRMGGGNYGQGKWVKLLR